MENDGKVGTGASIRSWGLEFMSPGDCVYTTRSFLEQQVPNPDTPDTPDGLTTEGGWSIPS